MPTARTLIQAVTALCLLLQPALAPVAFAAQATAPDAAVQTDVPPCHGDSATQAQPDASCCPDECRCMVACGGGFALGLLPVTVAVAPASDPDTVLHPAAVLPAYAITPFRPPITLQS